MDFNENNNKIESAEYPLEMVAVHFSTKCGASCQFCYSSDPITSKEAPTPLYKMEKILKKLASEGIKEILFVGGDPVIHPDFIKSLEISKYLGLSTTVLSNSWEIRYRDKFNYAISLIDNCEATILGSSFETHNSLTGRPKSFQKLIENLKRIVLNGKKVGVCVNSMPQNINEIYDIVYNLRNKYEIPIRSFMIQRIIPSGKATGEFKFGLNLDEVELLMIQIDRIAVDFNIPISFEDPVPWCTVDEKYHKYLDKCQWGYSKGAINSIGLLNRCGADDNYRLGSIFDGNIQSLWNENSILKSFRSKKYLPQECQSCKLLEKCGGGCPLSCGTFKDHDIDQLYIQKKDNESTGKFNINSPITIKSINYSFRYAYNGDLLNITNLESELFGRTEITFKKRDFEKYFSITPKSFKVFYEGNKLTGYLIIFPLDEEGLKRISEKTIKSILDFDSNEVQKRISEKTKALFVEVICGTTEKSKKYLLKNLIETISNYRLPTFTYPISSQGKELSKRLEFKLYKENGLQYKEPI